MQALPLRRLALLVVLVAAFSICAPRTAAAQVTPADSLAMRAIYFAMNGANWHYNIKWSINQRVGSWEGVTVEGGRVVRIEIKDIADSGTVTGTIPPEFANLTGLTYLDLGGLGLTGPLPTVFWELPNLETLYISGNQFSGPIPPEISHATRLRGLRLSGSLLSGSIPAEIASLPNLSGLELDGNLLTGEMPPEIWQMTQLGYLNVANNDLTGSFPASIAHLTNLTILFLSGNQFGGELPSDFGSLTGMHTLYLNDNQFTGSIPQGIADWPGYLSLAFQDNQFTDLPDFSSSAYVGGLAAENNRFEFDDILPNIGLTTDSGFTYAPQDSVGATRSIRALVGKPFEIAHPIPGVGNVYVWTKDGVPLPGYDTATLSVASASDSDRGVYRLVVTNPGAPLLTLTTRAIRVDVIEGQRVALTAFFERMCGNQWVTKTGWNTASPLGEWFGVTVDNQSRVTELKLPDNFALHTSGCQAEVVDPFGVFPAEFFAELPWLAEVNLSGNGIGGPVPEAFFYMPNLVRLDMARNRFEGMSYNFWGFHCGANCFPGTINYSVGSGGSGGPYSAPLAWLDLSKNFLTGGFTPPGFQPTDLHPDYRGIGYLDVSGNMLTGDMAPFLKDPAMVNLVWNPIDATKCEEMRMHGCADPLGFPRWTLKASDNGIKPKRWSNPADPLPPTTPVTVASQVAIGGGAASVAIAGSTVLGGCEYGWGVCVNKRDPFSNELAYAVLDVSFNDTEGEIPDSLGYVPFLRVLNLSNNRFSGTLPETLGNLVHLDSLVLGNNNFSGQLPQSLTALTGLTYFDFGASGAEVPADPAFQAWMASVPSVISIGVEFADAPIEGFGISPVYPNPFGREARFTVRVDAPQRVRIAVYNLLGQRVAVVLDGLLSAGAEHVFLIDGAPLPAGAYVISVEGETFRTSGRAVVVR